ncbi:MAG: mitochondrial fission ELM1 family protein, partial [Rhizobiales bacterium]|nr:mitochondrial fission ELM1 family protein [Hyphomicrobiales bacterium]
MRILLIRDKRAGHRNQVEAIAAIAANETDVAIDRIDIRRWRVVGGNLRHRVFRTFADDRGRLLNILFGIRLTAAERPDLVIASGRATFIAGSLIARQFGTKLLHSGFLSGFDPEYFDLMLVQSPRFAHEPKSVFTPLPCAVDPEQLPRPRELSRIEDLRSASIGLLLGGNASEYRFAASDWRGLVELVRATKQDFGLRWRVSTSRRTPRWASQQFRSLVQEGVIEQLVDYRSAGPGSAADLFKSDAIAVTEDSRSMTAEAMAARRPVVVLRPQRVRPSRATEEMAVMACSRAVAVLPIGSVEAELFATTLLSLKPDDRDPRDAIAAAIRPLLRTVA